MDPLASTGAGALPQRVSAGAVNGSSGGADGRAAMTGLTAMTGSSVESIGGASGSSTGLVGFSAATRGLSWEMAERVMGCEAEHDRISRDKALEANQKERRFMTIGLVNGEIPENRRPSRDECPEQR